MTDHPGSSSAPPTVPPGTPPPTSPLPTAESRVHGFSNDSIAVRGDTRNGIGVEGVAFAGTGVVGSSDQGDGVRGTSRSTEHAAVSASNDVGGYAVWARSAGPKPAGYFDGSVDVTGTLHVNGTITSDSDVLLTNADCAEDFDVATERSALPGTVMRLDDSGVLVPADLAYDRRVVGVISGAGTYRPAIVLDRRPSSHRRAPIALVGKAFCFADATHGAIEIGDLLTSSPTPGHAMKASDPQRAFGATIGKALRPLVTGQGMIPILITLQ